MMRSIYVIFLINVESEVHMRNLKYVGLTLCLLSAAASAVDCEGEVTLLGYDTGWDNPTLVLSLEGGPTAVRICGLTDTYNGINPEVCKVIYSELLTAKIAARKVLFRFPDFNSCTAIPSWNSAKIGWHTFQ